MPLIPQELQIRISNSAVHIAGYVNAVGRDSRVINEDGNTFVEQIEPGTFAKAIARGSNINIMLNHKRIVGNSQTNLKVTEDAIGLYAEAEITDTEVIEKAKAKLLRGWSFGFYPLSYYSETRSDGMERRIVNDLELTEVTIVDDKAVPCYAGTSIEARSLVTPEVIEVRATYVDETESNVDPTYYEDIRTRISKLSLKED